MMRSLDLSMSTRLTEALRTNMSGGKTVTEMLAEATASVPFRSLAAATLRTMGFQRAVALDGGMKSWVEAGYPVRAGAGPRGPIRNAPGRGCHAPRR